jgi:hypothetical protein
MGPEDFWFAIRLDFNLERPWTDDLRSLYSKKMLM